MIRSVSKAVSLPSGLYRSLSTKGFQKWMMSTNLMDQKPDGEEKPVGLLKSLDAPSLNSSSGIGTSTIISSSDSNSAQSSVATEKYDEKRNVADFINTNSGVSQLQDKPIVSSAKPVTPKPKPSVPCVPCVSNPQHVRKASPNPPPAPKLSKAMKKQKKSEQPKKIRGKSKEKNSGGGDGNSDNKKEMCSSPTNMVPPSSVLSKLKNFQLNSNCQAFHLKASGHERPTQPSPPSTPVPQSNKINLF